MAITWAQVLARFPSDAALAAVDANAGAAWAEDAGHLSASFFRARYELAQILWAAHWALATGAPGSSGAGGPAGPVIARSEGGVSEAYASPSSSSSSVSATDPFWDTTAYGRMFAALLRGAPGRIMKLRPSC